MNFHRNSHPRETKFIRLDARHCKGCWECIEACPNDALGRIEVGWHRHAVLVNAEACTGCRKCVRVCEPGAIQVLHNSRTGTDLPLRSRIPDRSREA